MHGFSVWQKYNAQIPAVHSPVPRACPPWWVAFGNSGMLPDSWRGHFVRVPAQIKNLRDTSGKMPELRPESNDSNDTQPRRLIRLLYSS